MVTIASPGYSLSLAGLTQVFRERKKRENWFHSESPCRVCPQFEFFAQSAKRKTRGRDIFPESIMERAIDISEAIDQSKIGAFQISIFILCALCLIMDGFDVQAMGYVAPAVIDEWHIPNSVLGPVFGAALLGILIGSLLFSMMADKMGRRPALITAVVFFGVLTLLTARAQSIAGLLAIRFLSGVGLGGIMPNAMTLTGEYSPRRLRVFLMMFIS